MKISIITVSFNSAKTIGATILSVAGQQKIDLEHIIVDGASTDETMEVINRCNQRISTILSEPDNGIYDAMNKGIAISTGDIIGILNSDDLYAYPHFLADVIKCFNNPDVEGVYADLVYVDRNNTQKVIRYWKSGEYKKNAFLAGWMPPHPAFFVRKSCYEKYGTFNTAFSSSADYELMLRFIHKYRINLAYLPETGVKMRMGGQSNASLKQRLKAHIEDRLAWKINNIHAKWYTFYAKPLRKAGQFMASGIKANKVFLRNDRDKCNE